MDVSARNILEKQFHDAWRGYSQKEVDDFLDRVAETVDRLQRENQSLQTRIRELDQAVSASRDTEDMLKKTLVSAQKASEEAIASAKAKAQQLITDAEQRVNQANEAARSRMSSLEDEARRKTLDTERDHAAKKRDLDASIDRLRTFEADLKQRLRVFMEQQLKAFEGLVDDPPRVVPRPEGAANASVAPVTASARPQASPAVSRPVSAEPSLSPAGQPAARPTATPAPHSRSAQGPEDDRPQEEAETAAPRRGLRGLFWGDE